MHASHNPHYRALLLALATGLVGFWLLLQVMSVALGELGELAVVAALLLAGGGGYLVYTHERRRDDAASAQKADASLPVGRRSAEAGLPGGGYRDEASAAWRGRAKAPGETLRILMVGGGGVGEELIGLISGEGHEIVVVEEDPERAERLRSHVDGLVLTGNGSDPEVLAEAEIEAADVMVAVTDRDEVNVLACLLAKPYGLRTVARVRNPSLFKYSEVLTQRRLGIDVVINPERTTAAELAQLMQTPGPVEELAYFASGRVQMAGFLVQEGSNLIGSTLRELSLTDRYLVVMIEREDGRLVVPHGDTRIRGGDRVYVMGPTGLLSDIRWLAGADVKRPQAVMVLGAGLIGAQTARILEQSGMEVKIIESDPQRCRAVNALLDRSIIVAADTSDPEVLVREGLGGYGGLVAATGDDRTNLLMGYFARRSCGVRVVSELLDSRYELLAEWLKIDAYVNPRVATAGRVISVLHDREHVTGIRVLQHQRAEAVEAVVAPGAPITTAPLKDLEVPEGVLVGAILRAGEVITPRGPTQVQAGDLVVLFTLPDQVEAVGRLLRED